MGHACFAQWNLAILAAAVRTYRRAFGTWFHIFGTTKKKTIETGLFQTCDAALPLGLTRQ